MCVCVCLSLSLSLLAVSMCASSAPRLWSPSTWMGMAATRRATAKSPLACSCRRSSTAFWLLLQSATSGLSPLPQATSSLLSALSLAPPQLAQRPSLLLPRSRMACATTAPTFRFTTRNSALLDWTADQPESSVGGGTTRRYERS